jgi:thymidine phosphorylase
VKVGSGALLPDRADAEELARALVGVARGNGLPTAALLTDEDRVLGRTAGNAVEVREAIDHLTGAARDARLCDVTLALSAELLVLGGVERDAAPARAAAERALDGGAAAERFGAMVRELGGPVELLEAPERCLPAAPTVAPAEPLQAGTVAAVDVRAVGLAIVALGGGRARETDLVDPSVGLRDVAAPGERVGPGERPLALVHAADEAAAGRAAEALRAAYTGERRRPCRGAATHPRGPPVIPKAELHVHLEGTAPLALVRRLAERNGLAVPDGLFDGSDRFAYSGSSTSCALTTRPPARSSPAATPRTCLARRSSHRPASAPL